MNSGTHPSFPRGSFGAHRPADDPSQAPGLDWPGLLRLGLQRLRLTPEQFWALTPIELLLMLGLEQGSRPLTRDRLEALSRAFPDDLIEVSDDDG